jgi:hypothetical protein
MVIKKLIKGIIITYFMMKNLTYEKLNINKIHTSISDENIQLIVLLELKLFMKSNNKIINDYQLESVEESFFYRNNNHTIKNNIFYKNECSSVEQFFFINLINDTSKNMINLNHDNIKFCHCYERFKLLLTSLKNIYENYYTYQKNVFDQLLNIKIFINVFNSIIKFIKNIYNYTNKNIYKYNENIKYQFQQLLEYFYWINNNYEKNNLFFINKSIYQLKKISSNSKKIKKIKK